MSQYGQSAKTPRDLSVDPDVYSGVMQFIDTYVMQLSCHSLLQKERKRESRSRRHTQLDVVHHNAEKSHFWPFPFLLVWSSVLLRAIPTFWAKKLNSQKYVTVWFIDPGSISYDGPHNCVWQLLNQKCGFWKTRPEEKYNFLTGQLASIKGLYLQ